MRDFEVCVTFFLLEGGQVFVLLSLACELTDRKVWIGLPGLESHFYDHYNFGRYLTFLAYKLLVCKMEITVVATTV